MEYLGGGTLMALMNQRNQDGNYLTDEEANSIMTRILSAVKYIHSMGITHRDLKPGIKLFTILNKKKQQFSQITYVYSFKNIREHPLVG